MINFTNFFLFLLLFQASVTHPSELFNIILKTEIIDCTDDVAFEGMNSEGKNVASKSGWITANEDNPHFNKMHIQNRKGTLISVGTFRALIVFALGKFERLIMFDLNKHILAFNREHLQFILALTKKSDKPTTQRKKYLEEYGSYLIELNKHSPDGNSYYWQDDNEWLKVTNALKKNKIHVIRGNLFCSNNCNKMLLDALRALKTELTIDVSNVLQYSNCQYSNSRKNYIKTLRSFAKVGVNPTPILATTSSYHEDNPILAFQISACPLDFRFYFFPSFEHYQECLNYDWKAVVSHDFKKWQLRPQVRKLYNNLIDCVKESMRETAIRERIRNNLLFDICNNYEMAQIIWDKLLDKLEEEFPEFGELESIENFLERLAIKNLAKLKIHKKIGTNYWEKYLGAGKLKGEDLSNLDLSDYCLNGKDLSGANLANARLPKKLYRCNFTNAILVGAELPTRIINCSFKNANITYTNITYGKHRTSAQKFRGAYWVDEKGVKYFFEPEKNLTSKEQKSSF